MKIINIENIIPYDKNPRKNESAIEHVLESLKKHGQVKPIVLSEKGHPFENEVVCCGHTTLEALKKFGAKEVKVIYKEFESEAEFIDYNIRDNKTGEFAEWDETLLAELGAEFDINLNDMGFEFDIEAEDNQGLTDEDQVPEVPEEPKAKLGQIYKLGNHRLMCGDSTDKAQVEALMDGEKAVLGHNDPPYGMKKEKDGVLNDNLNYNDLLEFNKKWINLQFNYLKDNGSWYCWGIDEPLMDIYSNILKPLIATQKATFRNLITWDKGNGQGQLAEEFRSYPIADEKCLFVMCGVQGFNNNADNYFEGWEKFRLYYDSETKKAGLNISKICDLTNTYAGHYFSRSQYAFPTKEHHLKIQSYCQANNIDAFKKEYDELKKEYDSTRAYFNNTHDNMNNVWHIARTTGEEKDQTGEHATPKPLELCQRVIKSSSQEDDIVIDVFGGSGSTLIACEKTNRKCYMMELEPKYIDVIIKRWEDLTGNKAELLEN